MAPANIPVGACISTLYASVTNSSFHIWALLKYDRVDDVCGLFSEVVTTWRYSGYDGWLIHGGLLYFIWVARN
eukprot:1798586-Ditylum_brightwellii.AAC.1